MLMCTEKEILMSTDNETVIKLQKLKKTVSTEVK